MLSGGGSPEIDPHRSFPIGLWNDKMTNLLRAIKRLKRANAHERLLAVEAAALLAATSAAIALVPFRKVVARAAHGRKLADKAADEAMIDDMRRIVDAVADRVPWRAVCFQRGLTLHLMLRRRGVPSVLHYGIANQADGALKAHVWVTVAGRDVIGGEGAIGFARVASFPGD